MRPAAYLVLGTLLAGLGTAFVLPHTLSPPRPEQGISQGQHSSERRMAPEAGRGYSPERQILSLYQKTSLTRKRQRETPQIREQELRLLPQEESFLEQTCNTLEGSGADYVGVTPERVSAYYAETQMNVQILLDEETGLARDLLLQIAFRDKPTLYAAGWSMYADRPSLERVISEVRELIREGGRTLQEDVTLRMSTEITQGGGYMPSWDVHPP